MATGVEAGTPTAVSRGEVSHLDNSVVHAFPEGRAGSVLLFHGNAVHGSGGNISPSVVRFPCGSPVWPYWHQQLRAANNNRRQ